MPVRKKYSNATFTKRVDHEAGRHRPSLAISEPTVCEECGAVYANRRWTAANSTLTNKRHEHFRPAKTTLCPACKQQCNGQPRAKRAAKDNPLARTMEFKRGDGHKLTVTTTTEHLAQRLGHAVEKAFGGSVHYDFSHENKLARVSWRRD